MLLCREFTIQKLLPRFLHVKPKAKPSNIVPFEKSIFLFNDYIVPCTNLLSCIVFLADYYGNITMGLNRITSVPNSTNVWWKMSENRTGYKFKPLCKLI